MSGNPRRVRVASAMRSLLAEMLEREVKDPRVHAAGFVSINHVELNSDMSVARVIVSFSGATGIDDAVAHNAMAGLQATTGFLRGQVGRRLRLRHSPVLHFVADDSVIFQQRLRDLVRADEARAYVPDTESEPDASAADTGAADASAADTSAADANAADAESESVADASAADASAGDANAGDAGTGDAVRASGGDRDGE